MYEHSFPSGVSLFPLTKCRSRVARPYARPVDWIELWQYRVSVNLAR
jgi:hypothetical protein